MQMLIMHAIRRAISDEAQVYCVMQAIDGLDADVLTIENSRSGDEMLRALAKYGYSRDIGAGVYDVHSPVVPP